MTHYDPLMDIDLTTKLSAVTPIDVVKTNKREKRYGMVSIDVSGIETYSKLPKQARHIANYLMDTEFVGRGSEIIDAMISEGKIETKQNPAVLFAFYARTLEKVGMYRV